MKLDSQEILRVVCEYYEIDRDTIFSLSRKKNIVFPRQVLFHFCALYTKLNLRQIGQMGTYYSHKAKDHATVLHAKRVVQDIYDTDRTFRHEYEHMLNQLKGQYDKTFVCDIIPNIIDLVELTKRGQKLTA